MHTWQYHHLQHRTAKVTQGGEGRIEMTHKQAGLEVEALLLSMLLSRTQS